MKYIKSRTQSRLETHPVFAEVDGGLVQVGEAEVEIRYPEGLERARAILAGPAGGGLDFWMVDDSVDPAPNERCRPNDFPPLDRPGHPLHGFRLVPVVPSGRPDCVVNDDGELVPAITPEESP